MNAQMNSHWLKEAVSPNESQCPSLYGDIQTDICIVGGGFTGLWSAINIKEQDPSCDVVLIEKDQCGSGASGRNGGFVLSWWAKFLSLEKICGGEEAIRLAKASADSVDEIGEFCIKEGIDSHYKRDGWLWAATSNDQIDCWDDTVQSIERYQQYPFKRWDKDEVAQRSGSDIHRAGIFEPTAASLQPAILARGLRAAALSRGVYIYENTQLTDLKKSPNPKVITDNGTISTSKVILATNAWGIKFSPIRKAIVVVSSDIVITEPIPEKLQDIGWNNRMTISDSRMLVHYYRPTRDGRIAFGKGGMNGRLPFGRHLGKKLDGQSTMRNDVLSWLKWTYPTLDKIKSSDSWMGPIDRSKSGLPYFGALNNDPSIIYAVGYSGNGVGPSHLGGKIAASLALDKKDEWSQAGLVRPLGYDFPPEPIRYFGGKLVRKAIERADRASDLSQKPGPLTRYLASFAPAGLSPFKGEKS